MADEPIPSIDSTIAAAVNARIQAEVMQALAGDEVIGQFVASALQQPVEVKDPRRGSYATSQVPFLTAVLHKAIQDATKEAVARLITAEVATIEEAVRKALRRDITTIAKTLTDSLVVAADKTYGVNVDLTLRMPNT